MKTSDLIATKKDNNNIRLMNLLMTVAIILFHSKNHFELWVSKEQLSLKIIPLLYRFDYMLGGIALSFFFMASGFLLYSGMTDWEKCKQKIKRRAFSLLAPFILWNTLCLIYTIVYRVIYKRITLDLSFWDILRGFTIDPFDGPLWYILALILLLPFSLIFHKIKSKAINITIWAVITIASFTISCYIPISSSNVFVSWLVRLIFYLPNYSLGAVIALCGKGNLFFNNKLSLRFLAGTLSAVGIISLEFFVNIDSPSGWVISKTIPFLLLLSLNNEKSAFIKKIRISDYTFYYYAMHQTLISILNTLLSHIITENSISFVSAAILRIVFLATIIGLCVGFALLSKLILPKKISSALSGGR